MTDPSTSAPFQGQCTAHKKNGARCRKYAINGSNVCRTHGGAAPQVKRAAALRLLMAADSVAGELVRIALSKTASDATKVQAIFGILDRAGLNPRQAVDVDVAVGLKQSPEDIYANVVLASTVALNGPKPADWDDDGIDGPWEYFSGQAALPDPNVIDAEVVEDERERAHDERMEAVERERDKRRRRGVDPELPPAVEQRVRPRPAPAQRGTPTPPAPSIEDDPRDRQPVRSRDEALTKERERFLIQREGLAPKKRHQRRA